MNKLSSIYFANTSLIRHDGHYIIQFWYNDFFGWALSYGESFKSKENQSLREFVADIRKISSEAGIERITMEYKSVPYPPKNYTSNDLDTYFLSNWEIHKKVCKVVKEHFKNYLYGESWTVNE